MTYEPPNLSHDLVDWCLLAGFELANKPTDSNNRSILWSHGGEVRYLIGQSQDNWLIVTISDRMGPEQFIFAAVSIAIIERYFYGKFGLSIRNKRGLARLSYPGTADRFRIEDTLFDQDECWSLMDPSGKRIAISGLGKRDASSELSKISIYMTASINTIKESYLSTDGKPLFELV